MYHCHHNHTLCIPKIRILLLISEPHPPCLIKPTLIPCAAPRPNFLLCKVSLDGKVDSLWFHHIWHKWKIKTKTWPHTWTHAVCTRRQPQQVNPHNRNDLTDLSWSALRKRGRIMWRKLLVRSSLGWLFALLIEPFNLLLRKLCSGWRRRTTRGHEQVEGGTMGWFEQDDNEKDPRGVGGVCVRRVCK